MVQLANPLHSSLGIVPALNIFKAFLLNKYWVLVSRTGHGSATLSTGEHITSAVNVTLVLMTLTVLATGWKVSRLFIQKREWVEALGACCHLDAVVWT